MTNNRTNEDAFNSTDVLPFVACLAPGEILHMLGSPEDISNQFSQYSLQNAKKYSIIKCLITTQTAGFAMRRWAEFQKKIRDEPSGSIRSQQLAASLTEQSAWQRKLAEILTLLICFTETNEDVYYCHYLLAEDLARNLHQIKEQQEYFQSESVTLARETKDLLRNIKEVEHTNGFKVTKCWYLVEKTLISERKNIKPGGLTCSISSMIKMALEKARKFEKRALGYTYYHAISSPSENIHFCPLPSPQKLDESRFRYGINQSGLLAISIVTRAQEMLNIFPTGLGSTSAHHAVVNDPVPHGFSATSEIGDFIVVEHAGESYLAEIVHIRESKYGNASYEVEFLGDKPFVDINKDWVMANRCSPFMKRNSLEARVLAALDESLVGVDETTISNVRNSSSLKLAIRDSVLEVWSRAGIRNLLMEQRLTHADVHGQEDEPVER